MSRERPLGVWTAVLAGLGVLQVVALLVFMGSSTRWFQAQLEDDTLWVRLAIGWATLQLTLFLLSVAVAKRAIGRPRGARGRRL